MVRWARVHSAVGAQRRPWRGAFGRASWRRCASEEWGAIERFVPVLPREFLFLAILNGPSVSPYQLINRFCLHI